MPSRLSPTTPDNMPSSTKPICAIVEYASIRLRLVCAIATKLPSAIDSTDSTRSICCQSLAIAGSASARIRNAIAKVAIFGAAAMSSVATVGVPW